MNIDQLIRFRPIALIISAAIGLSLMAANPVIGQSAPQIVFLDFDTGTDAKIVYTPLERDAIEAQLERIYRRFDVSFTQTLPSGDFSRITFNVDNLSLIHI